MKKILLAILAMAVMTTGCTKFSAITPLGDLNTQDGNKVILYHDRDIPGGGEDTTIAVIRVQDGQDSAGKLQDITREVVPIFKCGCE